MRAREVAPSGTRAVGDEREVQVPRVWLLPASVDLRDVPHAKRATVEGRGILPQGGSWQGMEVEGGEGGAVGNRTCTYPRWRSPPWDASFEC